MAWPVTLCTERLVLRPWRESDAEALYAYASDPDVGPNAGWPAHRSIEESAQAIRDVLTEPQTFAITLREAGFAALCFHYSGSWGSDGDYAVSHCMEDSLTVLDYIRSNPFGDFDTDRVFLLGHSMGSILSGLFADLHGGMLDGLVLMGTPAPNPAAGAGLVLTKVVRFFKGGEAVSKLLCDLGSANMHVPEEKELGPSAWISYNLDNIRAYDADPLCGFPFTVGAMQALVKGMGEFGGKSWGRNVPKDLPVLVIAGADDPCGDFGKGPDHYAKQLQELGVKDARLKLILSARHEILQEKNRADTFRILGDWFTELLPEKEA